MKAATHKKIKTAWHNAQTIIGGVPREHSLDGDQRIKTIQLIFGDVGVQKMQDAESLSRAVHVVGRMLTLNKRISSGPKYEFESAKAQVAAEPDLYKWKLRDMFPTLTTREVQAAQRKLKRSGVQMKAGKVTGFKPVK